ncbi:MAG TPA: hypothetical protein VLH75_13700 [Longimicrobiales bacterium]|nr:hypothetical protein [Longimicrobiales bacterium]
MKTTKTMGGAALLLMALTSCGRGPELDTRTFALTHLDPYEAQALIAPYVYGDRAEAPGAISVASGAITVRETSDNLQKIERVLAQYDVARPAIQLHFQLIQADGPMPTDPGIAAVEAELRKLFQFEGYRMAGEAVVYALDGSEISQTLSGAKMPAGIKQEYTVEARVMRGPENGLRLEEVSLYSQGFRKLRTTVNVRPGQTLVLGSSSMEGASGTFFLTVTAEAVQG